MASSTEDSAPLEDSHEHRPLAASLSGQSLLRLGLPVLTLAFIIGVWHAYVVVHDVPAILLPSPIAVGEMMFEMGPTLLGDAAVTGATASIGLFLGTVFGFSLGAAMVRSQPVANAVLPYIIALRIAPLIAIAPLFFLWFGRGVLPRAVLVGTLTIFPITIATLNGLRSTPRSYLDLMESVNASPTRVFLNVRLPAAAPSVFAGLKIAATLSVIGAVVAEFVTLDAGIGYRVFETANFLQTTQTFAALVVLALLGSIFYLVPAAIERRYNYHRQ